MYGVSQATVIMISSLLKDSSDGLDAVLVPMIKEITYKVLESNHKLKIQKNFFGVWGEGAGSSDREITNTTSLLY
jgi:hypothetical protein